MSSPLFSLKDVSFHYHSRKILTGVNWELGEGEHCALWGPNGAGKTTLLRLLNLLLRPTTGQLFFCGQEVNRAAEGKLREWRREMAFVFQSPVLFAGTVKQNLEYGLSLRGCPLPQREQKVEAMLEHAQLKAKAGQKASQLSGGEAQRVAVARALVLEPRILLLDEPTTNLDRENRELIETLLEEYAQRPQTTIILVSHNLRQAQRLTQRAVTLEEGTLRETATIEESI